MFKKFLTNIVFDLFFFPNHKSMIKQEVTCIYCLKKAFNMVSLSDLKLPQEFCLFYSPSNF